MNIRLLVFLFLTMLCPIATIEAQDLSHAEKVLRESNGLIYSGNYERAEHILSSEIETLQKAKLEDTRVFRLLLVEYSSLSIQLHNYLRAHSYITYAKTLFEVNQDFGSDYVHCLSVAAQELYYSKNMVWAKIYIDTAINTARQLWKDLLALSGSTDDSFYACDNFISMLSTASLIYSEAGCMPDAISTMKEAIGYVEKSHSEVLYPYSQLAQLYIKEKAYEEAISNAKKAIGKGALNAHNIENYFILSLCYFMTGNNINACQTAKETSALLKKEIQAQKTFLSDSETEYYWRYYKKYLPFMNMILCNSNIKDMNGSIYDNILEYKGFIQRSHLQLQYAIRESQDKELQKKYAQLLSLRQRLEAMPVGETSEIYGLVLSLEKSLSKAVSLLPSYSKYNVDWRAIRDVLASEEIAIEFIKLPAVKIFQEKVENNDDYYYALILSKQLEEPALIQLCSSNELHKACINSDYMNKSELYRLIWKPLEHFVLSAKKIYFSPEEDLYTIPIECLSNENGKRINEEKILSRLSSTRMLCLDHNKTLPTNFALFGGIKYSTDQSESSDVQQAVQKYKPTRSIGDSLLLRGSLDDISQGTLLEVKNIGKLLKTGKKKSLLYSGSQASEENFKSLSSQPIDVIHVATHGFYWSKEKVSNKTIIEALTQDSDSEYSLGWSGLSKSGLLLAGAKLKIDGMKLPEDKDDGILCGSEIENLDLTSVDFVVLSACQTGLGYIEPEEGVYGLQRAFKKAGVKSILMTLWKVDDDATQLFMTAFYRDYLKNNSKQHALKAAQEYLKNYTSDEGGHVYSDPYYWAGFVLLDALN